LHFPIYYSFWAVLPTHPFTPQIPVAT